MSYADTEFRKGDKGSVGLHYAVYDFDGYGKKGRVHRFLGTGHGKAGRHEHAGRMGENFEFF